MTRVMLRSSKSPFEPISPEMAMRRSIGGANLGNLVFSDSVHKLLYTPGQEITVGGFRPDPLAAEHINETYDVLVLPFANAFRPGIRHVLAAWTELIRQLRIPVVVLGIGAQTSLDYDLDRLRPLDDTVRAFVSTVLDHGPSIGVRGPLTERYLNRLGFSDVDVIGCPSLFRYGDFLNVQKSSAELSRDAAIAVSMTSSCAQSIAALVNANLHRYPRLHYVAQDIKDLELLYWGDTSEAAGTGADYPRHRSHPLLRENQTRLYLEPETWIRHMAAYDFAFGTRIHGTITALLGGTPGMVLCHDSRTRELSEYFEIPHYYLNDLPSDADPAKLYAEADYTPLVSGHRNRFQRLVGYLDRHGVDHVHAPEGDAGAAFEKRLTSLSLAPPVEPWTGEGDNAYRFAWLKENATRAGRRQDKSDKQVKELWEEIATLRSQLEHLTNTPGSRAHEGVRGVTKRLTNAINAFLGRA